MFGMFEKLHRFKIPFTGTWEDSGKQAWASRSFTAILMCHGIAPSLSQCGKTNETLVGDERMKASGNCS